MEILIIVVFAIIVAIVGKALRDDKFLTTGAQVWEEELDEILKPVKRTVKKAVKKTAKKPVKKTAKKAVKKTAKKAVKKAAKKTAKKATKRR
jgi:regulatory protein YycI of two-component signal transduction system YycFG